MPDDANPFADEDTSPPELTIRETAYGLSLVHNGIVVGEVIPAGSGRPTISLNLGWCRHAGLRVVVEGDPAVDRKRGNIILDR